MSYKGWSVLAAEAVASILIGYAAHWEFGVATFLLTMALGWRLRHNFEAVVDAVAPGAREE